MDIDFGMQRHYCNQPPEAWFGSLSELRDAAFDMSKRSRTLKGNIGKLEFVQDGEDIGVSGLFPEPVFPNRHAFGQLCTELGANAGYLRKKPSRLAAECLNDDLLRYRDEHPDRKSKLLVTHNGRLDMRALTGPDYGRIWNYQVADLAAQVNARADGEFYNPKVWPGTGKNGQDRGGLWLNDRQIVLFFIDGGSLVDGGGERDQLYRGYVMRNSEVGDAKFYWELFYFRVVCGNLMIIGKQSVAEVSIIHRKYAAEHFENMIPDMSNLLAHDTRQTTEAVIRKAKTIELPFDQFHSGEKRDDKKLLEYRPLQVFPRSLTKSAIQTAIEEEGQCNTLWDIVQGYTAEARKLPAAQDRFTASAKASRLLEIAEAELV